MKEWIIPDNEALSKALKIAEGNPEAVAMVSEKYYESVKSIPTIELTKQFEAIKSVQDLSELNEKSRNYVLSKLWSGELEYDELQILQRNYYNFQDAIAQSKLSEVDINFIRDNLKDVTMIYDITDDSQFSRAYLRNGKQLNPDNEDDKKVIEIYDQCFHSWLHKNNMSSKDAIIFEMKDINKDTGEYLNRAKKEKIEEAIIDLENGLHAAVKKQRKGLELFIKPYQSDSQLTPYKESGG
jgi:hypothetical protein